MLKLIGWLRGGCRHRWGAWDEPEILTIGKKGRTVTPCGTVILHGERDIIVQWRDCERCGHSMYRQLYKPPEAEIVRGEKA